MKAAKGDQRRPDPGQRVEKGQDTVYADVQPISSGFDDVHVRL